MSYYEYKDRAIKCCQGVISTFIIVMSKKVNDEKGIADKYRNVFIKKSNITKCLNEFVKMNLLKKTEKGYIDSDETKQLLSIGKSRDEIYKLLSKKNKGEQE